jgi:hypothetical protein
MPFPVESKYGVLKFNVSILLWVELYVHVGGFESVNVKPYMFEH